MGSETIQYENSTNSPAFNPIEKLNIKALIQNSNKVKQTNKLNKQYEGKKLTDLCSSLPPYGMVG